MSSPVLILRQVEKDFGDFKAVAGVDLTVEKGEFLTLLGPSGCGKTTTLNLIAGFIHPSRGSICLNGKEVGELPPFKRDTAMVFQDYALFPHMSVVENVAFGLRMRRVDRATIPARVDKALEMVRLSGLGHRRPSELSGGQRQRVALARALIVEPAVLLLDEPLSNLDLKLRESMRLEITNLQREIGITAIFVTHDQGEALVMSDRIAVMNRGLVEQLGTPAEIYERPRTRVVAEFIGGMNVLTGEILGSADAVGAVPVRLPGGGVISLKTDRDFAVGDRVIVGLRPERCRLEPEPAGCQDTLSIPAKIRQVVYLGSRLEILVDIDHGPPAMVELPNVGSVSRYEPGQIVRFAARADDCILLPF